MNEYHTCNGVFNTDKKAYALERPLHTPELFIETI